jgi:hypothetical protein
MKKVIIILFGLFMSIFIFTGCENAISDIENNTIQHSFAVSATGFDSESSSDQLVVAKVFDETTREHIPAVSTGNGALDLSSIHDDTGTTNEWVTELALDGDTWNGTVTLQNGADLVPEDLVFLILTYPVRGEPEIERTGTGKVAAGTNTVTIETGEGFETATSGVFGHGSGENIGPAGGYIFYQKSEYGDNWRYLESAIADVESATETRVPQVDNDFVFIFGYPRPSEGGASQVVGTSTGIGTGEANTASLTDDQYIFYTTSEGLITTSSYAAHMAATYTSNTYSDWFLPSKDELNKIHSNLYTMDLGNFSIDGYWSSSEEYPYPLLHAWNQSFFGGYQGDITLDHERRVRPVRAF